MINCSLCSIVKNEEENIEEFLRDFEKVTSEQIILDTGSTDQTKTLAKKLDAKVFDFKWTYDFSAARNKAMEYASEEIVWVADADERIDEENREKVKKLLSDQKLFEEYDVVLINYRIWKDEKGEKYKKVIKPRIFKKELGEFMDPVHENLNIAKVPRERIFKSEIVVDSIRPTIQNYPRNVKILKKALKKDPNNFRYLFYLANDLQYSGEVEEAINYHLQFLEKFPNMREFTNRSANNLGLCYYQQKKYRSAFKYFLEALKADTRFIEPYLFLALIYEKAKQYDEAIKMYEKAEKLEMPKTIVPVHQDYYDGYATKKKMQLIEKIKDEK